MIPFLLICFSLIFRQPYLLLDTTTIIIIICSTLITMSCIHKSPSCHITALGAVYPCDRNYRFYPNEVPTLMEVVLRYSPQNAYFLQLIVQLRSNQTLGQQRCRNNFENFERQIFPSSMFFLGLYLIANKNPGKDTSYTVHVTLTRQSPTQMEI